LNADYTQKFCWLPCRIELVFLSALIRAIMISMWLPLILHVLASGWPQYGKLFSSIQVVFGWIHRLEKGRHFVLYWRQLISEDRIHLSNV